MARLHHDEAGPLQSRRVSDDLVFSQPRGLQAFKAERESCREIFKNAVGLEMPDNHTIDGKAVNVRKRLARMFAGLEKPDRTYIALLQLGLAYAYGTPDKMKPDESGKRSLVFIAEDGLPWQNDPMAAQEAAAIAAQQAQDKIEAAAAERKLQALEPDPGDDEDPDTPALVR
jgi:hypothetical protein